MLVNLLSNIVTALLSLLPIGMYNINGSASSAGLTMVQVVDGSPEPGL